MIKRQQILLLAMVAWLLCLASAVHAAIPPGMERLVGSDIDAFSIPMSNQELRSGSLLKISASHTVIGTEKQDIALDGTLTNVGGIAVSGEIEFFNEASAARVVLVDGTKEYLVYYTYPDLTEGLSVAFDEVCQETCLLPKVLTSAKLELQVKDARLTITDISYGKKASLTEDTMRNIDELMDLQHASIIKTLNNKNLGWVAGETSVSHLSYEEKKRLFLSPEVPINLHGFEYYKGGIFEVKSAVPSITPTASNIVSSFDWRNRHGQNWMTSVKNQGSCGSCWAFAVAGATEALTNVYYNQSNIDLDLSEQQLVSCMSISAGCNGGYPSEALDYVKNKGLVGEACFPYEARETPCKICSSPHERIKIAGRSGGPTWHSEYNLKRAIIEHGPLSGGIYRPREMKHAMTLAGYFYFPNQNGTLVWIFKNSWGKNWGNQGYGYMKVPMKDINWTRVVLNPVYSEIKPRKISCVDNDRDGYCNWGISKNAPATCSASCKAKPKDCDDSNPHLGPFERDFSCKHI